MTAGCGGAAAPPGSTQLPAPTAAARTAPPLQTPESRWSLASAELSLRDGQPGEALETLSAAIAAEPRSFEARELASVCLRLLDRPDEARALHRDAIVRFPEAHDGYRQLADLERALGCLDESLAAIGELEARAGLDDAAGLIAVEVLARMGHLEDARARAERIAGRAPATPEGAAAWHALGDMRSRTGDARGAIEALRRGSVLAPESPLLARSLGRELMKAGELAEARAELERASALAPDDIRNFLDLSVLCLTLGDLDAGERFMAAAFEVNRRRPTHDPAELTARWQQLKDGTAPVLR